MLCRSVEQALAAVEAGANGVYLDFLELTGTGEALRLLRERGAFVGVAPPRIRKPGEEKIDRYVSSLAPDAMALLIAAPWPGNVRQLLNLLEQVRTAAHTAGLSMVDGAFIEATLAPILKTVPPP